VPLQAPEERIKNCEEVALGFTATQAVAEALRCLQCKNATCEDACPLRLPVKAFIDEIARQDFGAAFAEMSKASVFPGICGRVCQKELYCEKDCLLGRKLMPVAIGALERFVADAARQMGLADPPLEAQPNGLKVALVGSGPASLITAFDLVRRGYKVTIFEALHRLGGVLAYGIPPFRLPRDILREEINRLRNMGVEFRTDFIVGRTASLQELFDQGYAAVFLGTGAGLPHLMGIPGENLLGVYTANEFLVRLNLMEAYKDDADTPVFIGKRTIVVGGGNSAMDAARWAKRRGSESTIMFRRGRAELRARIEEIDHAEEEGVHFEFLAVPIRLIGDETGHLVAAECLRMRLGEPDESGRPAPVPIPGSEYTVPVDTLVMAIGQSANPTVPRATPELITKRGKVQINETGQTSLDNVYAGGDLVRGGSTVILAMYDGRKAAESIDRVLREQYHLDQGPATIPARSAATIPADFRILRKRMLTPDIAWLEVRAPEVAAHWKPGQFIIERPTPASERIPLTLVNGDLERGTITLVVQALGKTSRVTADLPEGACLADLLGPLGQPATIEKVGRVLCAAGGVGVAELLPVARAFRQAGNHVTALCGARTASLIILDEELRAVADELMWATDDGSAGFHGNVVQLMRWWKEQQAELPALAHAIGPIPMMRAAAEETRAWGIRCLASLNPIMVDGTGMCGGCRVTVDGKVRFACMDGPEFDAHAVDFDELTRRTRAYLDKERRVLDEHLCRIGLGR
jgi:glutamate synthase (NADPH/NADH) small chain